MSAGDEPGSRPSEAVRDLLRGEATALAEAERLAARGDRVAALACGYWHQQADEGKALQHLTRAAEAGNVVAEGVVARGPALQTLNAAISRLPRLVEPVVHPVVAGGFVVALLGLLVWVWWGADTPRFMYDDAIAALRAGDLRAAKLALAEISRTYTRSRWAPRAKGGSLVLRGWELWEAGSFEAAGQCVDEAAQYPLDHFEDRYEQLKRTVEAERAAQRLYAGGIEAEKVHDFPEARSQYQKVLREYRFCRCAPEAGERLKALGKAETLYREARAALAAREWARTAELCRQVEELDVRSYKVAVTAAEAYEGYSTPRWCLAALWWAKAQSIHDTPDVRKRALNAARKCTAISRDPLEASASGVLVSADRARIDVTLRNVGDRPLWGIRFVITTGGDVPAYDELVIPDKDDALRPGQSRSFSAYVTLYGSRSYGYHYSDVRKLTRR